MATLRDLLTDPAAAGIYRVPGRLSVPALRGRIERAGLRPFVLDGDAITDKATLLRAAGEALAFPPYFGRNWDAFEECLTDLSWVPANGYALLYDHVAPLIRQSPDDWATARAIFAAAVDGWRGTGTPFSVLLRRTGGLANEYPLLRIE